MATLTIKINNPPTKINSNMSDKIILDKFIKSLKHQINKTVVGIKVNLLQRLDLCKIKNKIKVNKNNSPRINLKAQTLLCNYTKFQQ